MRAFVVLLCGIAAVSAQYDYTQGSSGSGRGSSGRVVTNGDGIDEGISGLISGGSRGSSQLSEPIQPAITSFNKEFYSYTAPEQEFNDGAANDQILNSLRRNLRVVFIKGPENNGLEDAALQLAKNSADDRTAIYVLNKQADIAGLADQFKNLQSNNARKPEVHFVKYRTQGDAENAQRAIQQQYNQLPGSSNNHETASAPVLDFVSGEPDAHAPAAPVSRGYTSGGPRSTYLPPRKRV